MKLFKKKVDEEIVLAKFDEIIGKIDEFETKVDKRATERERALESALFNAKHKKVKEYEDRIEFLNSEKESKDLIINQLKSENEIISKEKEDLNEKLESLLKIADDKNNELKYKNKELKRELKTLKDKGMVLPTRVRRTGPTKDTKQTLGIKENKISGATKKELKKINELREEECNYDKTTI